MVGMAERVLKNSGHLPEDGLIVWTRMREAHRHRLREGGRGHAVSWIPGHTTKKDVEEGTIALSDHYGNSFADFLAARAAESTACPSYLIEAAEQRRTITQAVQEMMVAIVKERAVALDLMVEECKRRDAEDVDMWEDASPQPQFFVTRQHRVHHRGTSSTHEMQCRLDAARLSRPAVTWKRPSDVHGESLPLAPLTVPVNWDFDNCLAAPLFWYWQSLKWNNDERGASWLELYLDFAAATGVRVARRGQGKWTLPLAARCFCEASREVAKTCNVSLWMGEEGQVASLSPFGFARVAGLCVRPCLIMGDVACRILVELGGADLSRIEAAAAEVLLSEIEPRRQPYVELVRGMLGPCTT
jgi:hypothetical protein